jgi:hypothetical protein
MLADTNQISARSFFEAWKRICERRKPKLLAAWTSCPNYTAEIFDVEDAVVRELADELKLTVYSNYYSLDAIFIQNQSDRVHCAPPTQNWFQNVRIAFEHENIFRSGLFRETSHLLIIRAELRVLVSYPEDESDLNAELTNLSTIISNSGLADADPAFLFIIGERIDSNTDIRWRAYAYQQNRLLPLQ